jgi:hypothetical protein
LASYVFENLLYLAVVCDGVAIVEESGAVGGVPKLVIDGRADGGGFGDVGCVVWGGGLDVG